VAVFYLIILKVILEMNHLYIFHTMFNIMIRDGVVLGGRFKWYFRLIMSKL